ncbi:MAG TPA: FtsX-like permease family protein, partial [Blastocatellia bacterium]
EDKGRRVTLTGAGTMAPLPRNLRPVIVGFYVLLMGLIVTIACMNLANMLLARGANRRKELAIRLSVGASRFRLVRQMLTEGILLSLMGGVAGLVLAYGLAVLNSQIKPPLAVPEESDFIPDWHAAGFVFLLAIACGIGFSLAPALRATRSDVTPALKEGSSLQLPGYRGFGMRNLLMVVQIAGSLMLLLITGFLVLGVSKATDVQTDFDPHTMYLLSIDPVRDGYTAEKSERLFQDLPQRLAGGSVRGVALAAQPPFAMEERDRLAQLTAEDSRVQLPVAMQRVGAGYFAAVSQPMLAGLDFEVADQKSDVSGSKSLPIVLSESASRGFFGKGNALGEQLRDDRHSYQVVGVTGDLKTGIQPVSAVYVPLTEHDFAVPPAEGITIIARSNDGRDAIGTIRGEIAAIDPNLSVFNVETLSEYLDLSRNYERLSLDTYGGIGLFGLMLAAIGLAGVTAYAVARRRREIGIRMALGARKGQVLGLVLREGAILIGVGTALGFLGACAMVKVLSTLTNFVVDALKIGTNDPRLLIGAPLLLAGLALLACYVPARKATKVDPLKALRQE